MHIPDGAKKSSVQVIKFSEGDIVEKNISDVAEIGELLDNQSVTWVNVIGLGDAEVLSQLGELFGIHRLALEDVVDVHQRPKS